jgi:hypothetical protein
LKSVNTGFTDGLDAMTDPSKEVVSESKSEDINPISKLSKVANNCMVKRLRVCRNKYIGHALFCNRLWRTLQHFAKISIHFKTAIANKLLKNDAFSYIGQKDIITLMNPARGCLLIARFRGSEIISRYLPRKLSASAFTAEMET